MSTIITTDLHFDQSKKTCLTDLLRGVDWSPKGSIDAPVRELVSFVNELSDYYTTSSCSGRISCFNDYNRSKGIDWLLVKHRPITLQELEESIDITTTTTTKLNYVMLKCEPFILHVQCRDILSAQRLHHISMNSGFRESGISLGQRKIMVAIRTTSFSMELPLVIENKYIMDRDALSVIVFECNKRLLCNFSRIDKLLQNLKNEFIWPCFYSRPLFPLNNVDGTEKSSPIESLNYSSQAFYGHSSSIVANKESTDLITFGGSGSNGRTIHPHHFSISEKESHVIRRLNVSKTFDIMHCVTLTHPVMVNFPIQDIKPQVQTLMPRHGNEANEKSDDSTISCQLVIICGGRKSPVDAQKAIHSAYLHGDPSVHGRNVTVLQRGDVPVPRWGHAVVAYGMSRWILTGGRNNDCVFSDCYLLEFIETSSSIDEKSASGEIFVTFKWTKLSCDLPSPRFFHATCVVQDFVVILSGGLGQSALSRTTSETCCNEVYALALPVLSADNACLREDHCDSNIVETQVLCGKLKWLATSILTSNSNFCFNRFGHTLTYIGVNSIAVIGGSTFDCDYERYEGVENDEQIIDVWDILKTVEASSLSNLTRGEVFYASYSISCRECFVESGICHDSLALRVEECRCHHQSALNEFVDFSTMTTVRQLLITGGGVHCPALFGSCFCPPLEMLIRNKSAKRTVACPQSEPSYLYDQEKNEVQSTINDCLVILIPKSRVKGVKSFLEIHKWLDKSSRISPVDTSGNITTILLVCKLSADQNHVECKIENEIIDEQRNDFMAIPVLKIFYEKFAGASYEETAADNVVIAKISKELFSVLHSLLLSPLVKSTLTASERKKKNRASKSGMTAVTSHTVDLCDLRLQFMKQKCAANKTIIAAGNSTIGNKKTKTPPAATNEIVKVTSLDNKLNKNTIVPPLRLGWDYNCEKDQCLVVYIPKSRLRGVKLFLEKNSWLDKSKRISAPAIASVTFGSVRYSYDMENDAILCNRMCTQSNTFSESFRAQNMAVPVTESFIRLLTSGDCIDDNNALNGKELKSAIPTRKYFEMYSLLELPVSRSNESAAERKKNRQLEISLDFRYDHDEFIESIQQQHQHDRGETAISFLLEFGVQSCLINKVKAFSCQTKAIDFIESFVPSSLVPSIKNDIPKKFEYVGDVIMIPEGFLEDEFWNSVIDDSFWLGLLNCFNFDSDGENRTRKLYSRIARHARIDPGLKRESRVRLLYPLLRNDSAGPDGDGWTEVVENNITFGFDITKVM